MISNMTVGVKIGVEENINFHGFDFKTTDITALMNDCGCSNALLIDLDLDNFNSEEQFNNTVFNIINSDARDGIVLIAHYRKPVVIDKSKCEVCKNCKGFTGNCDSIPSYECAAILDKEEKLMATSGMNSIAEYTGSNIYVCNMNKNGTKIIQLANKLAGMK